MNEHVYQADPNAIQTLQRIREQVQHCCNNCMHRQVRVQTMDGQVLDGVIAGVDQKHLYLSVPAVDAEQRQFFPGFYPGFYNPASSVILPLVLYELLVISLLG